MCIVPANPIPTFRPSRFPFLIAPVLVGFCRIQPRVLPTELDRLAPTGAGARISNIRFAVPFAHSLILSASNLLYLVVAAPGSSARQRELLIPVLASDQAMAI